MRKPCVTSCRDSRGRFVIRLHIERLYWEKVFELKPDATEFMRKREAYLNALIAVAQIHGPVSELHHGLNTMFEMEAPIELNRDRVRRFFLVFTNNGAYHEVQSLFKLTPHQCVEMDNRIRELPQISKKHFVVCFERVHSSINDRAIPLGWEANADAVYELYAPTGEYLPIKQRDMNYTDALRGIESDIVPYSGRIGLAIPKRKDSMNTTREPDEKQILALQSQPLYEQLLAAGYSFYAWPNAPKPLENEMPGIMQKWMYEGGERAYKINIHFFDLYEIENYPRDGSVPRFLFEVRLNLDNALVGRSTQLAGVLFRFRISSVVEAQEAADHFWKACGSPMA